MAKTVLFLGAGASSKQGGLLTDEILPAVLEAKAKLEAQDTSGRVISLVQFLTHEFHVYPGSPKEHYPGLPLLISLIDSALDRREVFYGPWDLNTLAQLREALEFGIFDVLEEALANFPTNDHYSVLQRMFPSPSEPCIITTNYDLVADSAMMNLSRSVKSSGGLPDYHCGIVNIGSEQRFGTLLKLHGSLNWLVCKTCLRLELGESGALSYKSILNTVVERDVRSSILTDGDPCSVCLSQGYHSKLRPLLVAPSHLKNYRNPHLAQVWYEAQRVLRQAEKVIFIGYSMPDDDVEVVYLVKRSLSHIKDPKRNITVVDSCEGNPTIAASAHPTGRRYQTLFGDIDWHAGGLNQWLNTAP